MKKVVILGGFLCLSLAVSIILYRRLDTATNRATMYLEQGISQAKAKEMLRQEAEQTKKVQAVFFKKNMAAEIGAKVFTICGDARLLIQGMGALSADDEEGCLISTALAAEVFKSTKVKGNHITLEEDIYIVRGVYHSADKELIRLSKDQEDIFAQVRVQRYGNELAGDTLQEFAMRHGLSGVVLQWLEFIGMVKGVLLLATGVLAMLPWGIIRKTLPMKVSIPTKMEFLQDIKLPPKVVLAGYIVLVAILLASQISIPIEMIPAKLSDFDYWSMWFDNVCRNVSHVFSLEKMGYEQGFLFGGIWSIVGSALVIFATLGLRKYVKSE